MLLYHRVITLMKQMNGCLGADTEADAVLNDRNRKSNL
jgi:hypothetical protein